MTDIAAAIGLVQLGKVDSFNDSRIMNAKYLSESLNKIKGIGLPYIDRRCKHVFHQFTVRLKNELSRDEIVSILNKRGIGTGIYYPLPIHKQPLYKGLGFNDILPVSEKASSEVFSLPVHPAINKADMDTISKTLNEILK